MVYVILADGFEEVEAIAPIDVMRRNNIDVKTVSIGGLEVLGAHNIIVKADMKIDEVDINSIEGVILPGGMPGTLNLQKDERVNGLIKYCNDNEILLGAICAAPMIFGKIGILNDREAVCFPGFEEHLHGAEICDCSVVVSDHIITSKGAGTALEFGSAIVDYLMGESGKGDETLKNMQYKI